MAVPEVLTPQSFEDMITEQKLGLQEGDYAGALQGRWGIATPFHKRNIGFTDLSSKDLVTMARFYIDFPSMTRAQIEALPVSDVTKKFLPGFAGGQPYVLMFVNELSYQRPEKLQPQPVHEDYAVFNTTGEALKPLSIMGTLYNTPTDPWARYMDALWQDLYRASKLARHKARLRLHLFDKVYYVMPGSIGFAFRSNAQDIASVQIQGFAWKVLSVAPVLQTRAAALTPAIPTRPVLNDLADSARSADADILFNVGETTQLQHRVLSAVSTRE